jgi:hypothetical protein
MGSGFEWDMIPYADNTIHWQAWWPQRGRVTSEVMEYGGAFNKATRQLDFTAFANYVYGTYTDANNAQQSVEARQTSPWLNPEGMWGQVQNLDGLSSDGTGTTTNAAASSRANYYLGLAQVAHPTYSLTMKPGWWNPQRLWLGDTARLVLNSGRINAAIDDRISSIQIQPGDGSETVVLSIGAPPTTMQTVMRKLAKRIANLERNQ